jgi:hypothetical protein
MKKYTLHLIKFKIRTVRDKKKNEITEVSYFDRITFDLAKYLAVKDGCALRFLNKKEKLCCKDEAVKAIGYNAYENILAIIHPEYRHIKIPSDISIYPEIKKVTLNKRMISWDMFNELFYNWEDNFFDYSIESDRIWGPSSLIPKNYKQITQGVVIEGDYVFCDNSWLNTNVSFSPIKIGSDIKETGILFSGKHKGRFDDESLNYYNQFVIRKT